MWLELGQVEYLQVYWRLAVTCIIKEITSVELMTEVGSVLTSIKKTWCWKENSSRRSKTMDYPFSFPFHISNQTKPTPSFLVFYLAILLAPFDSLSLTANFYLFLSQSSSPPLSPCPFSCHNHRGSLDSLSIFLSQSSPPPLIPCP